MYIELFPNIESQRVSSTCCISRKQGVICRAGRVSMFETAFAERMN